MTILSDERVRHDEPAPQPAPEAPRPITFGNKDRRPGSLDVGWAERALTPPIASAAASTSGRKVLQPPIRRSCLTGRPRRWLAMIGATICVGAITLTNGAASQSPGRPSDPARVPAAASTTNPTRVATAPSSHRTPAPSVGGLPNMSFLRFPTPWLWSFPAAARH